MNMTKERLREIIENVLEWGSEHDQEFMECLVYAMDLTNKEIQEFQLEDYTELYDEFE